MPFLSLELPPSLHFSLLFKSLFYALFQEKENLFST